MVSHWSFSACESLQVSRTRLTILADVHNAGVCMVCICPLISNSSNPFTNPLGIVPSTPTTIGITVTFMFHSFFSSLARCRYLSLFSLSFIFALWSAGTAKSTIRSTHFIFFLLSLGLVIWPIFDDPFASQNPWEVCASHSPGQILGFAYPFWSYGLI